MNSDTYVCLGDCQAVISNDEYQKGLTKCGTDTCELKGVRFVKGDKCKKCGRNQASDNPHIHRI